MLDERLRLLGACLSAAFDAMSEAAVDVAVHKSTKEIVVAKFAFANKLLSLAEDQIEKLEGEYSHEREEYRRGEELSPA